MAETLLGEDDYLAIQENLTSGIKFFNPNFSGTKQEAIKFVVNNQLSPTVLGRSAFGEKSLENAVNLGASQYLLLGAGYDTFILRNPSYFDKLSVFELDLKETSDDKIARIRNAGLEIPTNVNFIDTDFRENDLENKLINNENYSKDKRSFCSLLGVVYYLKKEDFIALLSSLNKIFAKKSSIVLDYPDEFAFNEKAGTRAKKQAMLANSAGETMFHGYSYSEMEKILEDNGFLIYEHLTPKEMTEQYFNKFNKTYPNDKMTGFDNTNYALIVK